LEAEALNGTLLPGGVAGILLVLFWQPWRRGRGDVRRGAALAFGAAITIAFAAINGWKLRPFPAVSAEDWIFWFVIAAAIAGMLPRIPRIALQSLLCFGMSWAMIKDASSVFAGALVWAAWFSWETLARKREGVSMPLVSLAAMGGAAGMFLALESASFALQAASIAACFGAAFVATLWRGAGTHVAGGIGPAVAAICGLLIYGRFYWNVPTASALLIAFAPAAAFAGELKAIRKRPRWQGVLIRAAATAIPAGIAVGIAVANAPEPYY
jgi:hypothetical protein